jgi:hypothetical protein
MAPSIAGLFTLAFVCWAAQYACMALACRCQFTVSVVAHSTMSSSSGSLDTRHGVGFVSYGTTLVFYAAAFPRLARNTPHSRSLRAEYEYGHICVEEHVEESLDMNRICNVSTVGSGTSPTRDPMFIFVYQVHSHVDYVVTYPLNLALCFSPTTLSDHRIDNYTLALCVLSSHHMGSSLNMQ